MPVHRRPVSPLDAASLERLALRYVERFATTRGKLAVYLNRKIRERGWEGPVSDPMELAERMAERGYIDDLLYAEGKARAMARRGLGGRRVRDALRHVGVTADDAATLSLQIEADRVETALAFARRRRIGPFAAKPADRATQARQVAALVRAGHDPALAWQIARMEPGENVEPLLDQDR